MSFTKLNINECYDSWCKHAQGTRQPTIKRRILCTRKFDLIYLLSEHSLSLSLSCCAVFVFVSLHFGVPVQSAVCAVVWKGGKSTCYLFELTRSNTCWFVVCMMYVCAVCGMMHCCNAIFILNTKYICFGHTNRECFGWATFGWPRWSMPSVPILVRFQANFSL